ncbi:hypothetical protein VN97_g7617 [Penicillium thymicola]|uniref:Uncharacterized protein n=1 Tax=Penicillium thymicola TaxID=293382 RepID=A0AAI9TFC2_PENTH|nr:hypothetical protein VN97_g7617 [Penicillium thymicola]
MRRALCLRSKLEYADWIIYSPWWLEKGVRWGFEKPRPHCGNWYLRSISRASLPPCVDLVFFLPSVSGCWSSYNVNLISIVRFPFEHGRFD